MQADLLAGTLELDPENDPVLGTTENGIAIRYHNKALTGTWDYDAFMKTYLEDKFTGSGTFYNLSGYLYITLGHYNWVIIGRNSSLNAVSLTTTYGQSNETISNFIKFASYSTYANAMKNLIETSTDAGSAINSANTKGIVNTVLGATRNYSITLSSYNVVSSADLNNYAGCVLCLCAGTTGNSYISKANNSAYYPTGDLKTAMTNVYNSISSAAGGAIQLTSLTTYGDDRAGITGSATSYNHSEYLFPLAAKYVSSSQNFCVETYLDTTAKRDIDVKWWLRSGSRFGSTKYNYYVLVDGSISNCYLSDFNQFGVRPAFVLKIT